MNEKQEIGLRLRNEALQKFGTLKEFADAIGKTQQYLNIYLSGVNAPGPKLRRLLEKAGLDVAYIMTGRRGREMSLDEEFARRVVQVMKERGIRSVEELRERLDDAERIRLLLGSDAYSTIVNVATVREKKVRYTAKKRRAKKT